MIVANVVTCRTTRLLSRRRVLAARLSQGAESPVEDRLSAGRIPIEPINLRRQGKMAANKIESSSIVWEGDLPLKAFGIAD